MLENGKFWSAKPESFNDPFDCKASILSSVIKQIPDFEKQHYIASFFIILKRSIDNNISCFGLSINQRKKLLEKIERATTLNQAYIILQKFEKTLPIKIRHLSYKYVIKAIENKLSEIGVISLTQIPNNILMWSHYAEKHYGFCLGFEFKKIPITTQEYIIKPVNYMKKFPSLDLDKIDVTTEYIIGSDPKIKVEIDWDNPNLQKVIFTKSKCWEYEKEWRILLQQGGEEVNYIGDLTEVIFGLRCDNKTQSNIIKAVCKYSKDVVFKRVQKQSDSFIFKLELL